MAGGEERAFADMLVEVLGAADPIGEIGMTETFKIAKEHKDLGEEVPWVVDMREWDQEAMTLLRALSLASQVPAVRVWTWLCEQVREQLKKSREFERAMEEDLAGALLSKGAGGYDPEPPVSMVKQVGFKYDPIWRKFLTEIWDQETLQASKVMDELTWKGLPDWATLGDCLVMGLSKEGLGMKRRFALLRNGVLLDVATAHVLEAEKVGLVGPMTPLKKIKPPKTWWSLGHLASASLFSGSVAGGTVTGRLWVGPPGAPPPSPGASAVGYARKAGKSSMAASVTMTVDTSQYSKEMLEILTGMKVNRGGIQYGTHGGGGALDINANPA